MSYSDPPSAPSLKPPRFPALRTIAALVLREMSTTYGRSAGGYVWAVLQPAGMIIMLSIVFSVLVRTPSLGTNFILFYATGYLPYMMYGNLSSKITASLRYSRALLAYPSVTWIDAVLARLILNFLTGITIFCIIITVILVAVETRTVLTLIHVINGIAICALVGTGVGLCNAVLIGLWATWGNIWAIITRPLFLASGVLFLYEDLPDIAQTVLWWNPLIHGTAFARAGFYPTYQASFASLIYGYGLALLLITLGLIFMRATYKTVLER